MTIEEPLWTSAEVALALGCDAGRPWYADGVQLDSRSVSPGDLFVALKGQVHDGHTFIDDAVANGAVAALVASTYVAGSDLEIPLVRVPDPLAALGVLGVTARNRAPATIVGVTGSVGKTSVVQALKHVMARQGPTHGSIKSYNNHVGVPVSLARMPRSSRYGVFEMGMNHAGEIDALAQLVTPDVAVVTTVGPAHIENFKDVAQIAATKAEIFKHTTPHGIAIIGIDHPCADQLVAEAAARHLQVITVSARSETADIRAVSLEQHAAGSDVRASVCGVPVDYSMKLGGDGWVLNSLLVLAVCQAVGLDLEPVADAFQVLGANAGRGKVHPIPVANGSAVLIDDSYNASPLSVAEAFKRIQLLSQVGEGRFCAVLADMQELGPTARQQHLDLAPALQGSGLQKIYALGPHMTALGEAAGIAVQPVERFEGLADILMADLQDKDHILVKGANAANLDGFVSDFLSRFGVGGRQ